MLQETETNRLIRANTVKWLGTYNYNLQKLERYYNAQQTMQDSGLYTKAQTTDSDYNRFFKPLNFSGVVIDEPMGYLGNARATITNKNERLEAWANDFFKRRIQPKLADVTKWGGLFGECPLYLMTDSEGLEKRLKCEAIPLVQNGNQMIYFDYSPSDPDEVIAALIYRMIPTVSANGETEYTMERVWLGLSEFKIERATEGVKTPREEPSKWELVSRMPNRLQALPLANYINPKPSDILDFMAVQDKLDKTELEIDFAVEFQGYPMMWTEAPTADGLEVGAGNILYGGRAGRIEAGDTSTLHARKDDLLSSGSKIAASLDLYQEVSAQQRSGEAEQHRKEKFYNKLGDKALKLQPTVARALQVAALMLSRDLQMYRQETRFLEQDQVPTIQELSNAEFFVTLEPAIPVNEIENVQIADLWYNRLDVPHETALAKAGIQNPQAEIAKLEETPDDEETESGTLEAQDDTLESEDARG